MHDITTNRHLGNPQSRAAFETAKLKQKKYYADILAILKESPATSKQIARRLFVPLNAISGRLSELKAAKLIKQVGETIDGAAVLRLVYEDEIVDEPMRGLTRVELAQQLEQAETNIKRLETEKAELARKLENLRITQMQRDQATAAVQAVLFA